MRRPSLSKEFFDNDFSSLPLLTQLQATFIVNAYFRTMDYKSHSHRLGNIVSLYTLRPMDMLAPAYALAVAENKCLHIESLTNNRASTTAHILGQVNQVKTSWCLQSALAHMSAFIKSLPALLEGYHPVL